MPPVRRPEAEEYDVESASAALGTPAYRPLSGIPEDVRAFVMRGASEGTSTRRDPLADAQERGALLDFMARQGAGFDNIGRELVGLGRRGVDSPRGQPVAELQQRQAAAEREAMRDPESPQASRLRALLGQTGADLSPEVLAQLTAEDGPEAFQVAGMRLQGKAREDAAVAAERKRVAALEEQKRREALDAERRKDDRAWQEQQRGIDRGIRREEGAANRSSRERAAAIASGDRAAKLEREMGEKRVGGYTFDPANPPSNDAAKQMASAVIARDKILGSLDRLESLYAEHGPDLFGPEAGQMESEWMNITNNLRVLNDMGVPNGADYAMLGKQLTDPTSLRGMLTSGARQGEQFRALRSQVHRTVDATARAYKFRPEGNGGAPIPIDDLPQGRGTGPVQGAKPQQLADVPVLKLQPGQKAADVIPEGEMRRVNMGGGKSRLVVKRNGKLKVVE